MAKTEETQYVKIINTKRKSDCTIYVEEYILNTETGEQLDLSASTDLITCSSRNDFEVVCMVEHKMTGEVICFNRHVDCDGVIIGDYSNYNNIYNIDPNSKILTCEEHEKVCCIPIFETIVLSGESNGTLDLKGKTYNKIFIDNTSNTNDIVFTLSGNISGNSKYTVRACTAKGKDFDCAVINEISFETLDGSVINNLVDIELTNDCDTKNVFFI